MQVVSSTISATTEPNIRSQSGDVLLRQHTPQRPEQKRGDGVRIATATAEEVPGAYMMLISRVDAMLREGRPQRATLNQLQDLLQTRLAAMPPGARKGLLVLPPVRALEVQNMLRLPGEVTRNVMAGNKGETVLELLRSPEFAAVMKEEQRTTTYSSYGVLQAAT